MAPQPADCGDFYSGGSLLVPRGFTSGNGCFINAPTIVHGPTAIIQTGDQVALTAPTIKIGQTFVDFSKNSLQGCAITGEASIPPKETHSSSSHVKLSRTGYEFPTDVQDLLPPSACHITTNCDHKGGSVTITTPRIQSGGCLIECIDSGVLFQSPIEMRPQLSGGGFVLQNRLSTEIQEEVAPIMNEEELRSLLSPKLVETDNCYSNCSDEGMVPTPPSGCQELPGMRRNTMDERNFSCPRNSQNLRLSACCSNQLNCHSQPETSQEQVFRNRAGSSIDSQQHQQSCCRLKPLQTSQVTNAVQQSLNKNLQIQVNATVQLPASLGQCTVNITATTNSIGDSIVNSKATSTRSWNNFNGGGIIQPDNNSGVNSSNLERRDTTPSTPVSWLMPCPWSFDNYLIDKDVTRLCEVKKLLQTSGWYHQELSSQQSENLLKEAPIGCWLMRDSSDSRYIFAVSVQTARGPTSVRVHFYRGRFRLDAEPRLAMAMPLFACPIKMLEYYVEYSKRMDEQKKEVWVDYSGEIYSQIYLTKPMVKEVRSLSHLARLAVHANKLHTDHLPPLIRKYLSEYPYSL